MDEKKLDMSAEAIASRALNAAPTEENLKRVTSEIKIFALLKKSKRRKS